MRAIRDADGEGGEGVANSEAASIADAASPFDCPTV
jgi:hypothetical protein